MKRKTKKAKTYKSNIFQVLDHVNRKDIRWYRNLTEDEQKAFVPLIVMRWMSGTEVSWQLIYLNELVNSQVFANHKHRELLFYLLTICGTGDSKRFHWNKAKSNTTTPTIVNVVRKYFEYSTIDAIAALPLLSNKDILTYAGELGTSKEDTLKIKKELKTR